MGVSNLNILVLSETKIASQKRQFVINEMAFDMHKFTKGDGFVDGIWLGWKSYKATLISL